MSSLAPFLTSHAGDDLLTFDSVYGVIICKACQYALVPVEIASHLRTKHQKDKRFTAAQITAIANHCLTYSARPPAWIKEMPVELDTPAIPFLHLYQAFRPSLEAQPGNSCFQNRRHSDSTNTALESCRAALFSNSDDEYIGDMRDEYYHPVGVDGKRDYPYTTASIGSSTVPSATPPSSPVIPKVPLRGTSAMREQKAVESSLEICGSTSAVINNCNESGSQHWAGYNTTEK
ncbi:hypothetical protein N431DRAFT_443620 [Stipitochalara longipes BDJ]|nr:hypothetical protein N431DRAFT_443620 [Stipitochalara longipes BDJ]